jgi:hypothetical protein
MSSNIKSETDEQHDKQYEQISIDNPNLRGGLTTRKAKRMQGLDITPSSPRTDESSGRPDDEQHDDHTSLESNRFGES